MRKATTCMMTVANCHQRAPGLRLENDTSSTICMSTSATMIANTDQ